MAEHRRLAKTVPDALLHLLGDTSNDAHRHLGVARARLNRALLTGSHASRIGDPPPPALAPLRDAGGAAAALRVELATAGRIFNLHCAHLGLAAADPLRQRWDGRLADALLHADEALRRIRSAAARFLAWEDAYAVFQGLRRGSDRRSAWVRAARLLARRGCLEAYYAQMEVFLIRRDLFRLFYDAWTVCV